MSIKSSNTFTPAQNLQGRFKELASSDPYQQLPRDRTVWDKLVNWFGFRSGYDKAQEQYNLASAEYQAQLAQLSSEEQYNSPIEQARRQRLAGLNPDLTGVSGEPASEFDNQQQSPDINAGDVDLGTVVGTVLDAFTGTTAILKDFKTLKQMNQAIDNNDMDLSNKMLDILSRSEPLFNKEPYIDSEGKIHSNDNDATISAMFGSRRNISRFSKLRRDAYNSVLDTINQNESYSSLYESQEKRAKHESQPFFVGETGSTWEMADLMRPLSEAVVDSAIAEANRVIRTSRLESKKAETEDKVLFGTEQDPSSLGEDLARSNAQSQIASNSENISSSTIRVDAMRIYKNMLQKLKNEDGLGAKIMSLFISNQILHLNPVGNAINTGANAVGALSAVSKLIP